MKKKLLLIINPNAGRGAYVDGLAQALKVLSDGGFDTTVHFTSKPKEATEMAHLDAANYDVVACMGGDGTLSEVLAGLMMVDNPPPVGYFPLGTANDVATTLGLPKNNLAAAARRIIKGRPHNFDVGGFGEDEYFAYIAAFGAFTEVSYTTPQDQKRALGHLAYVLQGAASLPNIESNHVKVEFDDGVIETDLVYGSMSNSTSVAGIVKLNEDMVSLGDGMSELVLVKDPGSIEGFGELVTSVLTRRFDSDRLIILHTKKARFTFDKPVAWTRDGEDGGKHKSVELVNYHAPVKLLF